MTAAFASQWAKLCRRNVVLGTFAASVAFAVFATVVSITSSGTTERSGPGTSAVTKESLEHASGIAHGIGDATQFLGIVALVLFAFSLASEYSYGTLRNLLVRQPRRLVLLGGSYTALAAFVSLAAVSATLASAGAALIAASAHGVDTSSWTTAVGMGELAKAAVDTSLAMIGFGTIGAALGILLRSPVSAIGIGIAYLLPVEAIVSAAVNGADGWLPGKALSAVAQGGTGSVGYGQALAVSCLYAVILAATCARVFHLRDVAS